MLYLTCSIFLSGESKYLIMKQKILLGTQSLQVSTKSTVNMNIYLTSFMT